MKRMVFLTLVVIIGSPLVSAHETDPDGAYAGNVQTFDFEPRPGMPACRAAMLATGAALQSGAAGWTGGTPSTGCGGSVQPYTAGLEIQAIGGRPGVCLADRLVDQGLTHVPKTAPNGATGLDSGGACNPTLPLRLFWNTAAKYVTVWIIGNTRDKNYWCMSARNANGAVIDTVRLTNPAQTDRYAFSLVMAGPSTNGAGMFKEIVIDRCADAVDGAPFPFLIDKVVIGR